MRTRTRSIAGRSDHYFLPSAGHFLTRDFGQMVYETMVDNKLPPGPLLVTRCEPRTWRDVAAGNGSSAVYTNVPVSKPFYGKLIDNRLNVKKLPTSNQFDILTTIAEFDDTIAMFGKKFLSSLSYGGYKWGWTPLFNDVSAINDAANAIKNSVLENNRRTFDYNATDKYTVKSVSYDSGYHIISQTSDVKVKLSGTLSYDNDICAFYDYMGFHPTPKLFWDLVPLSFAIDYILPIGDMLSNITPAKGWVKHANFTGWRVTTIESTTTYRPYEGGGLSVLSDTIIGKDTFVRRDYCCGIQLSQQNIRKEIGFKMPDFSQLLDIAYLTKTFLTSKKKGRR